MDRVRRKWFGYAACFALTVVMGILLRCLNERMPSPVFAVLTPVNSSPWEMGKLIFWPYIAAALATHRMTNGETARAGHYLTLVLTTLAMIALCWVFRFYSLPVYLIVLAAGLLLHALLWRYKCPGGELLWAVLAILLGIAFLLFTAMPPDGTLFADAAQAAARVTIPL